MTDISYDIVDERPYIPSGPAIHGESTTEQGANGESVGQLRRHSVAGLWISAQLGGSI